MKDQELFIISYQNECSGLFGPAEAYTNREVAEARLVELQNEDNGNEYYLDSVSIIS